ncbi:CLUMA_CG001196, isoform A [Clunio marinus]|uniref:CLUMA_CG001196, isoform A n=1 Tax=Clunio marinus TaxID=568069 RepID=A0A1J1HIL0_9DIPT|nr:CLUMA_CG001196, isoform A [Clunio marinus]
MFENSSKMRKSFIQFEINCCASRREQYKTIFTKGTQEVEIMLKNNGSICNHQVHQTHKNNSSQCEKAMDGN